MSQKQSVKVLYITDDIDIGTLLQLILSQERNDNVIICDPSKQSPHQAAAIEKPELIFLDPMLGTDTDSLELCQELKTLYETQKIPILFFRVPNPEKFHPVAKRVGAEGYLDYFAQPYEIVDARDIVLSGGTYYHLERERKSS